MYLIYLYLAKDQGKTKDEPRKDQERTNELPKKSESKKVHFIKIAILFTSLIPFLLPPRDEREMTEGTPQQLRSSKKCVFLILLCLFHHYGRQKKSHFVKNAH